MKIPYVILGLLTIILSFALTGRAFRTEHQPVRRAFYVQCSAEKERLLSETTRTLTHILWLGYQASGEDARDGYSRERLNYHFSSPPRASMIFIHYRFADLYWESYATANPGLITGIEQVPIHCDDVERRCRRRGETAYVGRNQRFIVLVRTNLAQRPRTSAPLTTACLP